MVGIFPGAGGTTRLVRKLGAMAQHRSCSQGKLSDPAAPSKQASLMKSPTIPWQTPAHGCSARRRHRQTVGRKGLQNARRHALPPCWFHDFRRRPHGARRNPRRISRRQGAACPPSTKARLCLSTPRSKSKRAGSPHPDEPSLRAMIRSLFLNKEALDKGAVRPPMCLISASKSSASSVRA